MIDHRGQPSHTFRRRAQALPPAAVCRLLLLATACCVLLAGCVGSPRQPPRPGRTTLGTPTVVLPAQMVGNYLLIEAKWDRSGPYRFLIDTGSSATLVTPALARRYGEGREVLLPAGPRVRVAGADGAITELPETTLRRLELGGARFDDVRVLIYDCAALSAHLGVRIDGILGFPLFRETLLTLDYPGSRVVLQPTHTPPPPGTIIAFDDARKIPLISVHLGDRSLVALIDSGSDSTFSLNPVGVDPQFAYGPAPGGLVSTISGDRTQRVGRLGETLAIGDQTFLQPIVSLTDELSAIGGGLLKYFAVTFDQAHDRVTFRRDERGPIETAPRTSAGLSFNKTPAYWRVVGVVPKSPADLAGVEPGDLVTRIDGEPVAKWDLRRYEQRVASGAEIVFTFLTGNVELERRVGVFALVP